MKDYIERGGKMFRVQVYYDKGGMNWISGNQVRRGYYVSVVPVQLETKGTVVIESFELFSGTKLLLKAVRRQSDKAMKESVALAETKIEDLINHLLIRVNEAHKS